MKLEQTTGPMEGSLSVIFTCPGCAHRIALFTNPGETQLVRALDVKIGGRGGQPDPWEFVRTMLMAGREVVPEGGGDAAQPTAEEGSTSRCPFSSVADRVPGIPSLTWDPLAERRLERIPDVIRPMARQGIERFAAQHGYRRITEEVIDKVRGAAPGAEAAARSRLKDGIGTHPPPPAGDPARS